MLNKHVDVTDAIIKAFYAVYNALGYGFSEKVYKGAMVVELTRMDVKVLAEHPIHVYYRGVVVAEFFADLFVSDCVIVELKSVKELLDEHHAQLLNYLRSTKIEVGLLVNFGPEGKFHRKSYDNHRKGSLSWTG
ncbi:MAG: GxxExxY protein [Caldilineaceae bacterium]